MLNNFYKMALLSCLMPTYLEAQTSTEGTTAGSSKSTESQKAILEANRDWVVNGGHPDGLAKVSVLSPEIAIPYLQGFIWNYKKGSPEFIEARKAILNVSGYEKYYILKLEEASKDGVVDNDGSFEMLALLGTSKAIGVVAPYLFDFTKRKPPANDDMVAGSKIIAATETLGKMDIPDAPAKYQRDTLFQLADIVAWQKWGIEKGYVGPEYKARIGIPEWLAEISPAFKEQSLSLQVIPTSYQTSVAPRKGALGQDSPSPDGAALESAPSSGRQQRTVRELYAEPTTAQADVLQKISDQVEDGHQPAALREVSALPPEVAIPFLEHFRRSHDKNDPGVAEARTTILSIPGYDKFLAETLEAATRERGQGYGQTFETLVWLKSDPALRIWAAYLFDVTQPVRPPTVRDDEQGSNLESAFLATNGLDSPDAPPKPQRDKGYLLKDIIAWQKWVIAKGYVPAEYKERIGIPRWLAEKAPSFKEQSLSLPVIMPPEHTGSSGDSVQVRMAPSNGSGAYQHAQAPRNVSDLVDRYITKSIFQAGDETQLKMAITEIKEQPDYLQVAYLQALAEAIIGWNRSRTLEYDPPKHDTRDLKTVAGRSIWALEQLLNRKYAEVDGKPSDSSLALVYSKAFTDVLAYRNKISQRTRKLPPTNELEEYYGLSSPRSARSSVDRMARFLAEWPPIDGDVQALENILGSPSQRNLWEDKTRAQEPDEYEYYVWPISGGAISHYFLFRVQNGIIVSLLVTTAG